MRRFVRSSSHLAAFHARFWQREDVLSYPWLMSLRQPVDYFYRCVVDSWMACGAPAESTAYIVSKWPWFPEGVINLLDSLEPNPQALNRDACTANRSASWRRWSRCRGRSATTTSTTET